MRLDTACDTGENRGELLLLSARVEPLDAELAAPRPLGRLLDRRDEAVHVIAAVAVVAEEQLFSEIQMLWSMFVGDKVLKLPTISEWQSDINNAE